ncbi:hypothetical protein ABPG75_013404 [Micractinium tetrahymenae]
MKSLLSPLRWPLIACCLWASIAHSATLKSVSVITKPRTASAAACIMALELSPAHGAVGLVVVGAAAIHSIWMGMKVGQARRKYDVTYPALYAPAGHKNEIEFNCIQRAHQNSLENLPTFYALLLTAGARFPISAAVAGAVVLLGRIAYFNGYSSGDPKNRQRGGFLHLGSLALLGMVARWSVELLAPALKV